MTLHSHVIKDRLRAKMGEVLGSATASALSDELDRLGQIAVVATLLDELSERSSKVTRAVLEALPEVQTRAGLAEASVWLDLCIAIAESSGATALKFVKESPWILAMVDSHDRRVRLFRLGIELAERDANVALEFIRVAPELARRVADGQLEAVTEMGCELTDRDYVLGLEFFRESPRILEAIALDDIRGWVECGLQLITTNQFGKTDYFATIEYLRSSPRLLLQIAELDSRRLVVRLGATLASRHPQIAVEVLAEAPALLERIESSDWQRRMLQRALLVAERDGLTAQAYCRRCPEVVGWLGYDDRAQAAFDEWFKSGMEVLSYSLEGARAYFALETKQAMSALQEAQSGVPLRQVARSVKLFVQALCGRDISVRELPEEEQPNKAAARARVSPDGRILFLPGLVRRHADRASNARLYTVMAAHEAGHLEFGTYDLSIDSLQDLVQTVEQRYGQHALPTPKSLGDLFDRYPQPGLVRDLWTILEDARIEQRLREQYPGLRHDLATVAKEAIEPDRCPKGCRCGR